jgi:hypothetical protein
MPPQPLEMLRVHVRAIAVARFNSAARTDLKRRAAVLIECIEIRIATHRTTTT